MTKIHPLRPANNLSKTEAKVLCQAIKKILKAAIKQGGTTLKDFQQPNSKPGYFRLQLAVYGRDKEPCVDCEANLELVKINGRATVYCARCQS